MRTHSTRSVKKKTRRGRKVLKSLALLFILAILLWYFWTDLEELVKSAQKKITPQKASRPAQENIFEEERRELEKILKQR